ncbi:methyltransferase, FkbM family [Beggiatoa alba B18LD]|uniref:Methyltransferase, FkbM family n=1 Tax=Beggiatoa alba B18LD TaxID=395493 RepID=I3CHN9_9GAMM|nr:FkbM family methyltransferase [Beggiatoa alba]EIJ43132.1 methyltransferase, FkbM family [Beggiatoa alba B18LD]
MFRSLNLLLSKFIEKTNISRWLFRFFTRILPVPTTRVRGVPIKIIIPLHQVGVYDQFKHWEQREPETLDWIDKFDKDCVLFDIGASFGNETLYAALKANAPRKIICFDLDLLASFNLANNLQLNNIQKVEQYYIGIAKQSGFINAREPTNYACVLNRPKYDLIHYKTYSIALDDFIAQVGESPDYLKVDVDGIEVDILEGMPKTLADSRLKSILIEVGYQTLPQVQQILTQAGFVQTYQSEQRGIVGSETYNLIFSR